MRFISHNWGVSFFAAIAVLVTINLYTIEMFPIVWGDEISFAEPAAHLADTGRLVSLAWPYQSDATIWAGNAPLHSILLAGWLSFFDTTPIAVRSFGVIEFFGAIFLLIFTLARFGVLTKPSSKFILAALLSLAYGTAINYRSGRYDPTGILLLAISFFLLTQPRGRHFNFLRYLPVLLIFSSGLHVAVYFSICLGAAYVWANAYWRRECIKAFVALTLGGALFAVYLIAIGQLEVFIESARYLKAIPEGAIPKDPSLALLFVAALAVAVVPKVFWGQQLQIMEKSLLTIVLATPCVFFVLGRYPTYYSWMVIFPAALLITIKIPAFFEGIRTNPEKRVGFTISFILVLACAVGLPLQIASGVVLANGRDYEKVKQLVRHVDGFDGPVLVDPAAWYAVKPFSSKIYLTTYDRNRSLMSVAQRESVRFAVVSRSQFRQWRNYLGGEWIEVDQYPHSIKIDFLGFKKGFGDKLAETYDLVVFRKVSNESVH